MSKKKNKKPTGTGKQMPAATNSPPAVHEATPAPTQDAATSLDMNTTKNHGEQESGSHSTAQLADSMGTPANDSSVDCPATTPGVDPVSAPGVVCGATRHTPGEVPATLTTDTAKIAAIEAPYGTLGQRLRAAREAKGWSVEDVASRLRLPAQTVRTLEVEQYEKIGYGIYLRGYLMSYARLVDVPTVLIEPVLRERSYAPPLVASGTISHSRYLYQRYSVSAMYLILTGVIIVPAVLLAMRAGLQPDVAHVTALDASSASVVATAAESSSPQMLEPTAANAQPPTATQGSADAAAGTSEAPLVASLAPFSALSRKGPAVRADAATVAGAHTLKLSLKEASWVQVVSASGEKLEFGLLPAGSVRNYASDKGLDVRLGNCNGAEIEADGKSQDLTPFRHANVAHFKVLAGDEAISRSE